MKNYVIIHLYYYIYYIDKIIFYMLLEIKIAVISIMIEPTPFSGGPPPDPRAQMGLPHHMIPHVT